jgi:uncharacterized protein (DUF1684 family)
MLFATNLPAQDHQYQKEIDKWYNERIQSLKAENGWLNLAGLFWLEEGKNSFGTGRQNNIVFPEGSITEQAGYFERSGNIVTFYASANTKVLVNGKETKQAVVFNADSTKNPVLSYGNLKWNFIKRDDKIGLRLRDLKSPVLTHFKGIERFPVKNSWKAEATVQKKASATVAITNVLGQTNEQKTPGTLVFTVEGKEYRLDPIEEGDHLLVVFGDATSGEETYPAGRFIIVDKPGPDGKTVIDFNKAYNPPCAFSPYATCPLPPKQNILPIPVTAGEKTWEGH